MFHRKKYHNIISQLYLTILSICISNYPVEHRTEHALVQSISFHYGIVIIRGIMKSGLSHAFHQLTDHDTTGCQTNDIGFLPFISVPQYECWLAAFIVEKNEMRKWFHFQMGNLVDTFNFTN